MPLLISIVIPARNRAGMIGRALRSCKAQDRSSCEVIVVDDGSTDDTCRIVREYGESGNVRLVEQDRAGAAAARNRGAQEASGDAVLFLDSDDELTAGAVRSFGTAFSAERVAAVCAPAQTVKSNGDVINNKLRQLGASYENQVGLFLAGTFAVRRDAFFSVGGFAAACPSSQHTEFSLRLLPHCRQQGFGVVGLKEPSVRIYAHEGDHLRGNLEALFGGAVYIITHHENQLRKCPRHFSDWCSIAAIYAAKLGHYGQTRSLLWQAVRAYPSRKTNFARLALAHVPVLARAVWKRHDQMSESRN